MALQRLRRPLLGALACLQVAQLPAERWFSAGQRRDDPGETIDFGYQQIPKHEKQDRVRQVFSSVASSYDIMNDLMSGGLHRLWKDRLVDVLQPFAGMQHLDVAGGTGDVAFRVLREIRRAEHDAVRRSSALATTPGSVTICDINPDMLEAGKARVGGAGLAGDAGLSWVVGNAEELPFHDASFDAYTIAFGIRNVTNRDAALREAHRVLRPGGRLLVLEFSRVNVPGLREIYEAYSFHVIPKIGELVARDGSSYQYLVESIRKFPDQDTFADMIEAAGFSRVGYENMTGGVVALHSGFKL